MKTQEWRPGSPFRGIVERPYDQGDLADVDWRRIEPTTVEFTSLWLTQNRLTISALFGMDSYSTDLYPRAVRCAGELYLEDGHHRVIVMALGAGRRQIACGMRIVDLKPMQAQRDDSRGLPPSVRLLLNGTD